LRFGPLKAIVSRDLFVQFINIGSALLLIGLIATNPVSAELGNDENAQTLLNGIHDYSHSWWVPLVIKNDLELNIAKDWWPKMLSDGCGGIKMFSNLGGEINEYYKRQGWTDLEETEAANNNDRDNNKSTVEQQIGNLKNKLSFRLNITGVKCDTESFDLCYRYVNAIGNLLESEKWLGKGQEARITLNLSPATTAVAVTERSAKDIVVDAAGTIRQNNWEQLLVNQLIAANQHIHQ
jgi:hypothetical protein